MANLKWSTGNSKVSKLDAVSFGIPALQSADGFKTCPKAGACAAVCYARQGMYIMPNVKASREFNLAIARKSLSTFEAMAIGDLAHINSKFIRVHDSGDFYSQEYLNTWTRIASAHPDKVFYAYTKSLHLDYSKLPANFRVTQSQGGKLDASIDQTKPHSRIFATHADRRRAGYSNGSDTDTLAIRGAIKIGLVYHGTKKLSDAQTKFFS